MLLVIRQAWEGAQNIGHLFRPKQPQHVHKPVEVVTRVEVEKRPAPTATDALHEALRSDGAGDYMPTPKEAGWKPLSMDERFRLAEGRGE